MTRPRPDCSDAAEPCPRKVHQPPWTPRSAAVARAVLVMIGMLGDLMFFTIAGIVAAVAGLIAGFIMGKAGKGTKGHAKAARH